MADMGEKTAGHAGTTVGFIGAGTVGTALAVRLSGSGYRVVAAASRSRSSAERLAASVPGCTAFDSKQQVADAADLVFITTPDDAIGPVAAEIAWHPGQSVVHCSGADSIAILEKAREDGAFVGGFHPLQTFASVTHAIENIPGSTFAIEAEEPLLAILKDMAVALQGTWVKLNADDKVLYHAAAVMACNYFVTLVKLATDLWGTFGASPEQAIKALMPLLRGTLNNVENVGLPNCLTGPIARGDIGTIRKHVSALKRAAPEVLSAYRELGLHTIPIGVAKGTLDAERAEQLRELLKEGDQ